ncbi:MAG: glycosyltransferase family 2 protein [Ignavibacteriales bacterium]|nr:glycosyltransferase family 2 protein [Ignavibacteriales bacterium]MCF8316861.1 glycosyltransferase family 2 protein [Ignavibacteriales bacterium]MCF8438100.1 glycosyltransferase family 2 protein [Ignavibacteriales bacterium]
MKFTVFTPVYNRGDKIHRVWDSLRSQTFRDFEWIVVDDGSKDNVMDILGIYKNEADFPVTILRQENKGKHFAWNRAAEIAQGELFVPADSDDSFIPRTLEFFACKWDGIPARERKKFSGMNVLCGDPETGSVIGDEYPESPMVTTNLELSYKYKIQGEKWGCIRTDLLKRNKYPEITGRGSYILSYMWYKFSRKYKVICFNEILRNYYPEKDSISAANHNISKGSAFVHYHYGCWHQNENFEYMLRHSPVNLLKFIMSTIVFGFVADQSIIQIINSQNRILLKILVGIFIIPALLYNKWQHNKV